MRVRSTTAVTALLALGLGAAVGGCGKGDEFPDRTARVVIDGERTTFALDSCGLDQRTLFVVGRATDGSILQAVVGLRKDLETGVPASTGFSIDHGPSIVEAFGAESWERRQRSGAPPGRITSAALRGSRIQVGGDGRNVGEDEVPIDDEVVTVSIDARCDERDD